MIDNGTNELTKQISVTDRKDEQSMDQIFDFDLSIDQNEKIHKPSNIGKKLCRFCRTLFDESEFEEHCQLMHATPYECGECPSSFDLVSLLEDHFLSCHNRDSRLNCCHCKFVSDRESDIDEHKVSVHSELYRLACGQCSFKCCSGVELKDHCATHAKLFNCRLCLEKFTSKEDLDAHKVADHKMKIRRRRVKAEISSQDETMDIKSEEGTTGTTQLTLSSQGSETKIVSKQKVPNQRNLKTACITNKVTKEPVTVKVKAAAAAKDKTRPLCHVCGLEFSHQTNLRYHMLKHSDQRPFECPICHKKYKRPDGLKWHMVLHTADWVYCKMCDYKTLKMKNLVLHERGHFKEKTLQCKLCEYKTSNKHSLDSHLWYKHGQKVKVNCTFCGKFFTTISGYNHHLKIMHGKRIIREWVAKPKNFLNEGAKQLTDATSSHTDGKAPNESQFASAFLIQVEKLNDPNVPQSQKLTLEELYEDIELKEKEAIKTTFICEKCGKSLKNSHNLKNHMVIHKEQREFKCTLCTYSGRRKADIGQHMKAVHLAQVHNLKCAYCDYTASKKHNMVIHVRTHTGERPFACDKCSFRTTTVSSLRVHNRIHTGLKPFACANCPRRFRQGNALRTHRCADTSVLPQDPDPPKDEWYTCTTCGFIATNKLSLVRHKVSHRAKKTKSFACAKCLQPFNAKYKLMRHKCPGMPIDNSDEVNRQIEHETSTKVENEFEKEGNCVEEESEGVDEVILYNQPNMDESDEQGKLEIDTNANFDITESNSMEELEEVDEVILNSQPNMDESDEQGKLEIDTNVNFDITESDSMEELEEVDEVILNSQPNMDESICVNKSESNEQGNLEIDKNDNFDITIPDSSLILNGDLQSFLNPLSHGPLFKDMLVNQEYPPNPGDLNIDDVGPEVVICEVVEEFNWEDQSYVVIAEAPSLAADANGDLFPEFPAMENEDNQAVNRICNEAIIECQPLNVDGVEKKEEESFVPPVDLGECCICDACGKMLKNKNAMAEHLETHSKKPFKCEICNFSAARSKILRQHLLKTHNIFVKEKPPRRKERLPYGEVEDSMNAGENNRESLKCLLCSYSTDSRLTLEGHLQTHRGARRSTCETCSKKFYTVYQMRHHKCSADIFTNQNESQDSASELSDPNTATDILSQAMQLTAVEELQTEKSPNSDIDTKENVIRYKCNSCFETFLDILLLQSHLKAHTNDGLKNVTVSVIVDGQ